MKEVTVANWDDLHFAEGERIPAAPLPAVKLSLDGRAVELDLSAENRDRLTELLEPYFKAGTVTALGTGKNLTPGMSQRAGLAERRAYYKGLREFADAHGGKGIYHYVWHVTDTGSLSSYYPVALRKAYAAHLASQDSR